jgi:hypothetical protein
MTVAEPRGSGWPALPRSPNAPRPERARPNHDPDRARPTLRAHLHAGTRTVGTVTAAMAIHWARADRGGDPPAARLRIAPSCSPPLTACCDGRWRAAPSCVCAFRCGTPSRNGRLTSSSTARDRRQPESRSDVAWPAVALRRAGKTRISEGTRPRRGRVLQGEALIRPDRPAESAGFRWRPRCRPRRRGCGRIRWPALLHACFVVPRTLSMSLSEKPCATPSRRDHCAALIPRAGSVR